MNIDFKVTSPEGIPYIVKAPLGTAQSEVTKRVQELHSRIQQADPGWDVIQGIESHGDVNAVSKKGAVGDMQTMPKTLAAPGFGVTPAKDDSDAERHRVGVDYWNKMKETFKHPLSAAMGYNWGPTNLQDWLKGTNTPGTKHPDFTGHAKDWSLVPQETKDYVKKVISKVTSK